MGKAENEITKGVLDLFAMAGWLAWRQNNNPTPIKRNGRVVGVTAFNGLKGVSDVIALQPDGPGWFVEVKNPDVGGRKGGLRKEQREFRDRVLGSRHVYLVVYSTGDLYDELVKRGFLR